MKSIIVIALFGFIAISEARERLNEDQLIILPNKYKYDDATRQCANRNLRLVKVEDNESNELLYKFALKNKLGKFWVDGNDRQVRDKWVYSDGERLTFTKWAPGEPNNRNTEKCIEILHFKNSLWNNIDCNSPKDVICYKPKKEEPEVPVISERQLVVLPTRAGYKIASCMCRVEGLKLVKVEDPFSNMVVFNFAQKRKLGKYWMNGNDFKVVGRWEFNGGCRISYTNWYPGEPNYPGVERCLEGGRYPKGLWNNIKCNEQNAIICYKEI